MSKEWNDEFATTMLAADKQLEASLTEIFAGIVVLPDNPVECIHSHGYCEDGKTFALTVDLADGSTLFIQACPGSAVTAHVEPTLSAAQA